MAISPRSVSLPIALAVACTAAPALAQFTQTTLTSNQSGVGTNTDAGLTNGWGIASGPTGSIYVSSGGANTSTLYNGLGAPQSGTVSIPGATAGTFGSPTGVAFAGGSGFMVNGQPANFLWSTRGGTIAGWNNGASATTLVNNSASGASFTGLGLANTSGGPRLFATDFANGQVAAFDNSLNPITTASFTDPTLPAGYSPFNVQSFGDRVFVTYAQRNTTTGAPILGAGNGLIDVYDANGTFVNRFTSGGTLNAPWGLAMAPSNFGAFSNALLVGNYGSGMINAYDPNTGMYLGQLTDSSNNPLVINGLYGIGFGNGGENMGTGTLFYAAGPDNGTNGAFGQIQFVPSPAAAGLLALGALGASRRRR